MKKLLLAAVAVISIGFASSSFAGDCGTSYVTVKQQQHYVPQTAYVYQQPYHKEVKYVPVHQPVVTTYVKPAVKTYKVHTPVYYHYTPAHDYTPVYHYNYTSSCSGH